MVELKSTGVSGVSHVMRQPESLRLDMPWNVTIYSLQHISRYSGSVHGPYWEEPYCRTSVHSVIERVNHVLQNELASLWRWTLGLVIDPDIDGSPEDGRTRNNDQRVLLGLLVHLMCYDMCMIRGMFYDWCGHRCGTTTREKGLQGLPETRKVRTVYEAFELEGLQFDRHVLNAFIALTLKENDDVAIAIGRSMTLGFMVACQVFKTLESSGWYPLGEALVHDGARMSLHSSRRTAFMKLHMSSSISRGGRCSTVYTGVNVSMALRSRSAPKVRKHTMLSTTSLDDSNIREGSCLDGAEHTTRAQGPALVRRVRSAMNVADMGLTLTDLAFPPCVLGVCDTTVHFILYSLYWYYTLWPRRQRKSRALAHHIRTDLWSQMPRTVQDDRHYGSFLSAFFEFHQQEEPLEGVCSTVLLSDATTRESVQQKDKRQGERTYLNTLGLRLSRSLDVLRRRRPFVICISGGSGCGKSTLALMLAMKLGCKKVISTDTFRHVLRSKYTKQENPILFASTYEANKALQALDEHQLHHFRDVYGQPPLVTNAFAQCVEGYLLQSRMLYSIVEHVVERELWAGDCAVLEGVHLTGEILQRLNQRFPRQGFSFYIYLAEKTHHLQRLATRSANCAASVSENNYIKHMGAIQAIEAYLAQSFAKDVMFVENASIDVSVERIRHRIIAQLHKESI